MDARSPFAQVSGNQQRYPGSSRTDKKRENHSNDASSSVLNTDGASLGTHSTFNSPSKSSTSHSRPTSSSQPERSSPSKPLPPVPAWNSLYNTPRKLNNDIDDSSAGETPKSPEREPDSDATPENMGLKQALQRFDIGSLPPLSASRPASPVKEKERPKADRRESIFGRIKNKIYSPGRGEIPRGDYQQAMEKKVRKQKSREVHRQLARKRRYSVSDSGDESEQPPSSPRKTSASQPQPQDEAQSKKNWLWSTWDFIGAHPTVPHILTFYAQLAFNLFLLGGCAYLIWCFWAAVQGDVDKKAWEAAADIVAEISACAEQYRVNKCDRDTRLPALETVCENWAKCMNRDPMRVGRAKVSAHTFAEIFNSFVEPISYKAMAFTFILVFGLFATSNLAFGSLRTKTAAHEPQYNPYYPPPTPQQQRSFSGQDGNFYQGTPWHQPVQGLEPTPSGGFQQIEGRGSPVRRLVYN